MNPCMKFDETCMLHVQYFQQGDDEITNLSEFFSLYHYELVIDGSSVTSTCHKNRLMDREWGGASLSKHAYKHVAFQCS